MWAAMRNFMHGTGHGVGFCLNVHEGPQNISRTNSELHKPGMITTIEPGLYRPGEYGIRIENMVLCQDAGSSEFGSFLKFDTLTRCPINTRLVKKDLLDEKEIKWLNEFNSLARKELIDDLSEKEKEWLVNECRPL